MEKLNLPSYKFDVSERDGQQFIFDPIRKKELVLTPEEWVRQHLVQFLMDKYYYPRSLFRIEGGLKYGTLAKRSDIVVYDRDGKPFLLVECKSPTVKIDQAVFDQAAVYNKTLKSPFLAISNGLDHYICQINLDEGNYSFLRDFPLFPEAH